MFTAENIEYQFLEHRDWKALYTKYYPGEVDLEKYVENSWEIFRKNGYTIDYVRYSNNPNSKVYTAIKEVSLMKDGEEVVAYGDYNYFQMREQFLVNIISGFDVDFKTFN